MSKRLTDITGLANYLPINVKTLLNRLTRRAKDPFPIKPVFYVGRSPRWDLNKVDQYLDYMVENGIDRL